MIHQVEVIVKIFYSFQLNSIVPSMAYAPEGRGPDSPEPLTITVDGINLYGMTMLCRINGQDTSATTV